ncbi:MAG: selenide, water dikinase SelD [Halothiobacillus sp.]
MSTANQIRLTQYSHGAGCGCKISPALLDEILHTSKISAAANPKLIVGNESRDDAAVYDLGDGTAIISTTDFFMPIVDDPFTFGRIAATNAISDIYAMGGTPLLAIAIFAWPIDKLPAHVASEVIDGGKYACKEAGIPLAGGHSIDAPEPIFGLAVTGRVQLSALKRNDTAQVGDILFLTKPLGIGILTTAQKNAVLRPEDAQKAADVMCKLNKIGAELSSLTTVTAMTDVTGFGLGGHLLEMCRGSQTRADLNLKNIPLIESVEFYLAQKQIPGGTYRNFASYGKEISAMPEATQALICDPQTSGGLLIAVRPEGAAQVQHMLNAAGCFDQPIGYMQARIANEPIITISGQ